MKVKVLGGIVLAFLTGFFLIGWAGPGEEALKERTAELVAEGRVSFRTETNPDYRGSYTCTRDNWFAQWPEWGEWDKGVFKDNVQVFLRVVRVGLNFEGRCSFSAAPGYHWIPVWSDDRIMFSLQKK